MVSKKVVVSKEGMVSNEGFKIGMTLVVVQARRKRRIREGEVGSLCHSVNCFKKAYFYLLM